MWMGTRINVSWSVVTWVCSMQNQERIDAPLHIQIVGTRVCLETSDFDINTHLERVYVPVVSGDLVMSISIKKLEHERINKVEVFFNFCFFYTIRANFQLLGFDKSKCLWFLIKCTPLSFF